MVVNNFLPHSRWHRCIGEGNVETSGDLKGCRTGFICIAGKAVEIFTKKKERCSLV